MLILDWLQSVNRALWGFPMIVLLFGTHLFLTCRTRFIQKRVFRGIRLTFSGNKNQIASVSPFRALATALASTVGSGNIIGIATAIVLGGPGAVFWCWLTGIFGMSTKYSECLLAMKYRVKNADGSYCGGPMYTLKNGLGLNVLSKLFAVFCIVCSFGIGSSVQSNAITAAVRNIIPVGSLLPALIITAAASCVILGGIKQISKVCGYLVPFMVGLYVLSCLYITAVNHAFLGDAVIVIVKSAFSVKSIAGGVVSGGMMTAMRYGVSRGLFSNESGLGSAPIAAASADSPDDYAQALVSMTGTFWDTVVICALTGITIVSSMLRPGFSADYTYDTLTFRVFDGFLPFGSEILTVCLILFAFSTIVGWSYYGETSVRFLFGKHGVLPYRLVYLAAVFAGAAVNMSAVWAFSDFSNACMAVPNVISLLLLSGVIAGETRKARHTPKFR